MSAIERAETTWTEWRYDGTGAGIMARLSDGVGREVGIWMGRDGYGHNGRHIQVYGRGRNNQVNFSASLLPDEARSLAASILAMADKVDEMYPAPIVAGDIDGTLD